MKILLEKINTLLFPIVYSADTVETSLDFRIPKIGELLTFLIRLFFIIAGLAALIYLLTGALQWITSGGDKENVKKAQDRIQNAIIGLILIVVVLVLIIAIEQVVFNSKICLGLSCEITIPKLLKDK